MKSIWRMLGRTLVPAFTLLLAAVLSSCQGKEEPYTGTYEKVGIICMYSHNSLYGYAQNDIKDIKNGYLPSVSEPKALFIVSHISTTSSGTPPQNGYVTRISRNSDGDVVCDTVYTVTGGSPMNTASAMSDMIGWIGKNCKSKSYGLAISSHGAGWLPIGYYKKPEGTTTTWSIGEESSAAHDYDFSLPGPPVKSITEDVNNGTATEMDIKDFALAFPFHLDYLMIDCCLMGGIETAYELKGVADRIGFSQTEIGADGFDYSKIGQRMLSSTGDAPVDIAMDYYNLCSSSIYGGSISIVNTSGLANFAGVCKPIFNEYRTAIESVRPSTVQGFFRYNRHYFYDMRDILVKAGVNSSSLASFDEALDKVVSYEANTEWFMKSYGGFAINTDCGLTMYLPSNGTDYLDSYYKGLAWNKASGLVN